MPTRTHRREPELPALATDAGRETRPGARVQFLELNRPVVIICGLSTVDRRRGNGLCDRSAIDRHPGDSHASRNFWFDRRSGKTPRASGARPGMGGRRLRAQSRPRAGAAG